MDPRYELEHLVEIEVTPVILVVLLPKQLNK